MLIIILFLIHHAGIVIGVVVGIILLVVLVIVIVLVYMWSRRN